MASALLAHAQQTVLVVDSKGGGDFKTIQEAINSLPNQAAGQQRIIFIRKGVYREKVFIEKNFVTLLGEDKEKTQLVIAQARDIWRCEHADDWGVATVNLKGNDLVLENLTITNSFGFDHTEDMHIDCPDDHAQPFKTVKRSGHQMALRSFTTTRLIVRNCILRAYGGDTVSPWNTDDGMFYFSNCLMEGGVDFYCPRGWAYAENCVFVAHGNTAAIWHDGSKVKDSKTVLKNCVFRGEDGFKLGRYHRDAQFYLINCSFAKNMADAPIYLNPSQPQNTIQWGKRVYYFNCHHEGGDYAWHANNLQTAEGAPDANKINAEWTFGAKWHLSPAATVTPANKYTKTNKVQAEPAMQNNADIDPVAERMLVYQRAIGGWPKAVNEIKVDYTREMSEAETRNTRADSLHIDATFDNNATSREIRYLAKAYQHTKNKAYLDAAEKGIRYCLKAQDGAGGWPQYYPDSSLYRSQITYNDNAMINVLNILQDIAERTNGMEVINSTFVIPSHEAVQRAVVCILATQINVNGQPTAWCAQYNKRTLQPEMARKFELVSISGSESVGIVLFLMRLDHPSAAVVRAVQSAVTWFKAVKIEGYACKDVPDASKPKGTDRVLLKEPGSIIWARFYEIGTNRPFFSGRDSIKKYNLADIEYERRTGYAWYGTWPAVLLNKDYPEWMKKNNIKQ